MDKRAHREVSLQLTFPRDGGGIFNRMWGAFSNSEAIRGADQAALFAVGNIGVCGMAVGSSWR